jgi:hypothetical protein
LSSNLWPELCLLGRENAGVFVIFENLLATVFDPQKILQPANIHLAEQG